MVELKESKKLDYLLEQVKKRVGTFHKSAKTFRGLYIFASLVAVSISASITILTAINRSINNELISIIIVGLGTTITVLTALNTTYSSRETWMLYYTSLSRLRSLETEIDYKIKDPGTLKQTSELDALFNEYQKILSEHSDLYSKVRGADKKRQGNTGGE